MSLRKRICLAAALWLVTCAAHAQVFTALADFSDGSIYLSSLIQGRDGNFYGTSQTGGLSNSGSIFKLTPGGALTTLYSFCSQPNCADGKYPGSALALGVDGNFYGAAGGGGSTAGFCGSYGCGVVFKVTPSGAYTLLHTFSGADGNGPVGLVLATDASFYGTTSLAGGASCEYGCGTVFKITANGALTTLHSFVDQPAGFFPDAPLVQGSDGDLYGTTYEGGDENDRCIYGCGTVFKISTSGAFTSLHWFDFSDGAAIAAPVTEGADGSFYGTALQGGFSYYELCTSGCGTLFKVTSLGMFTTLKIFDGHSYGGSYGGLTPATDQNAYEESGADIYQVTPAGGLTTTYSFSLNDAGGTGGMLQGSNGIFYGSYVLDCCEYPYAGLFSLNTGLGPFVAFVVPGGRVGQTAEILGQGFTGTTSVTFDGVAASEFTVVSDTYLTAVVPKGASTGSVVVDTPSGSLNSNVNFRVIE